MADDRTYIKLHDGMPGHPKVRGLSDKAFRCYVTALCYCSEYLTDGDVVAAVAKDFGTTRIWRELHEKQLVDPTPDGWRMHDYLEHQRSAEQVRELKEKRRSAGRKGGRASTSRSSTTQANAKQVLEQVVEQTPSKTQAETESLTNVRDQTETEPSLRDGGARKRATQISNDFVITDAMRSWAVANRIGVDLDRETAKFADFHRAKGSVFKDWQAAWRTWMRKAIEYGNVRQLPLTASGKEYQPWNP